MLEATPLVASDSATRSDLYNTKIINFFADVKVTYSHSGPWGEKAMAGSLHGYDI